MQTRSSAFPSAQTLDGQDDPEDVLREVLGGRYSVEVNIDGITDGVPGEWAEFSNHDTLSDALRASSAFMAVTKELLGVSLLDDRQDGRIEPWIRVLDHWNEEVALWVEDGLLHVREEE